MKASQLYVGEYYAWTPYPPKGKLAKDAVKVRLRGTLTRKGRFDTNAKTFALITVVDTGREKEVRARELVDFWDNYESEIELIRREAREREAEVHRNRVHDVMVATLLTRELRDATGMDLVGQLEYARYNRRVTIPVEPLLKWLDISESDIENAVDKYIEGENGKEA
jgi:hypothetical protein